MARSPAHAIVSMFQSLFSWMTLIGTCPARAIAGFQVSILVFLDDAHRPLPTARTRTLAVSILVFLDDAHRHRVHPSRCVLCMFQSLFSWMTLIGLTPSHEVIHAARFQSLFSWMTLIGTAPSSAGIVHSVSILVFLDDAHRQSARSRTSDLRARFQSLFSWMTLIGASC